MLTISQIRKDLRKEYNQGLISHKEYKISLNTLTFFKKIKKGLKNGA